MKSEVIAEFQDKVSQALIRHRSILDSLSKYHESTSRVSRAITKTVTNCGCISINASKQQFPPEISFKECQKYMDSHLNGELCETCREIIEEEIGNHLFYLTALCTLLGYSLEEIFNKEYERISTLGAFYLS